MPLESLAVSLAYKAAKVWVGGADGSLAAFTRVNNSPAYPGYQIAVRVATVKLGPSPVCALVAAADQHGAALYAASGLRVSVIDADAAEVVRVFSVKPPPPEFNTVGPLHNLLRAAFVTHLCVAGTGIIAAVSESPLLYLYHTETLALVERLDITDCLPVTTSTTAAGYIRYNGNNNTKNDSETPLHITAVVAGPRDILWVGTSVGIVLTLPLPRLPCGLPLLASGAGHASRHAHCGPVRLVLQVPQEMEAGGGEHARKRRMGDGVMSGQPRIPCLLVPPLSAAADSRPLVVTEEEEEPCKTIAKSTPRMRGMLRKHDNAHHHHHQADRRASKTLPRGFSLSGYRAAAAAANEDDEEDEEATAESMLQLYGELVNVRDYDCSGIGPDFGRRPNGGCSGDANNGGVGGGGGSGETSSQQQRHSSDPDLAAIPYRVSTLDRRISMKLQRARSLDLSSWSLGSRTSSWTTSSSSGRRTQHISHSRSALQ